MNTTPHEVGYSTPRDTFLYLLGLIALVVSAVSFIMLVYQFIDLRFPDVLQYGYGYSNSASSHYAAIRTALAALIVVFPVFFWVSRVLHKDVIQEPAKRNLRIRRWLLYFTVFVAGLVVIGDLVTLINSFLNGELTAAFILKVITVFFVAGSALFYYLSELRDRTYPRRLFQGVIIGAVVLALGYAFYVAGSPQSQRLVRLDEQKISHLQMIQERLVYHWQQKGSLPQTLSGLDDPISSFMTPVDPQTGGAYEYHVTGPRAFQLCATFNKESADLLAEPSVVKPALYASTNWQHGAGQVCFDRTIDPALYPVSPGKPVPAY